MPAPVLSIDDAALWAEEQRRAGRRVVFTNGVYDLVHPGHIEYLEAAKAAGDVLIVAVNSDRSVRGLKGNGRPIQDENARSQVLAALEDVDGVVLFDEETPAEIIALLEPDVLVKGGDYTPDQVVGREVVERGGGRVVIVPLVPGQSSSAIVERMQRARSSA